MAEETPVVGRIVFNAYRTEYGPNRTVANRLVRCVTEEEYERVKRELSTTTTALAEARKALQPLAQIPYEEFLHKLPATILMGWNTHKILVGDVIAARAALAGKEEA